MANKSNKLRTPKTLAQNSAARKATPNQPPKQTGQPFFTKFRTRAWLFSFISIASFLSVILGYWFTVQSVSISFTSKLTQIGDIELLYNERQGEKISPLCGCYDIGEWSKWRGITFSTREIEIERKGDYPATGYLIFSPAPSPVSAVPDFFKMRATYYLIELTQEYPFNPIYLLSNTLPSNYILLKKMEINEGFVQLFTNGPLNISLLGNKPLGAWIPMENSNVSIKYQLSQDISQPATTIIKERYKKSTQEELDQTMVNGVYRDLTRPSLPIADFLGPGIVLWNDEEPTSILASSRVLHVPSEQKHKRLIKALVVNPPFAARVAAIPFDNDAIFKKIEDAPSLRKADDYSPFLTQGRFDNGEVSVKIKMQDSHSKEYESLYQSIKQQGVVSAKFETYNSQQIGSGVMEFRYPPLPPNNGFNIFGSISYLKTNSALGSLLIGSRSFNIEAPAILELKNINKYEVRNGILEVPIQIGFSDTPANVQLKATSEIFVNNESITRRVDNNKTLIDYLVLIASILGAALAVLSAIIAVKDFRKSQ